MSRDEVIAMLDACAYLTPRYRSCMGKAVIAMYVYAGLRTNEVLELLVRNLSRDGGENFRRDEEGDG